MIIKMFFISFRSILSLSPRSLLFFDKNLRNPNQYAIESTVILPGICFHGGAGGDGEGGGGALFLQNLIIRKIATSVSLWVAKKRYNLEKETLSTSGVARENCW